MLPKNWNTLICRDADAAGREAAERFACAAVASVAKRGQFFVALPGGSGPRGMFKYLADNSFSNLIPWNKTVVFFTDERCVPPDSEESNYKQAYDLLFSHVPIPPENIHRFAGELDPQAAADLYEQEIRDQMGDLPRFDMIILGMGSDTHTASLFPYSSALEEGYKLAVADYVEKLGKYRLTLTLPVLCSAESILVIAVGEEKADAVRLALKGEIDIQAHPIQGVQPIYGKLIWLLDEAAVSRL